MQNKLYSVTISLVILTDFPKNLVPCMQQVSNDLCSKISAIFLGLHLSLTLVATSNFTFHQKKGHIYLQSAFINSAIADTGQKSGSRA